MNNQYSFIDQAELAKEIDKKQVQVDKKKKELSILRKELKSLKQFEVKQDEA